MNALQRLELLSEHAELVQVIPTLKAMAKLDSLERLSEIVALLGGNPYSSDNPHAQWAKDDEHIKQNADNWENRLPQLTTEKVDEYNAKAEPLGYVGDNEPRHAGTGIYNVSKWVDVGDKQYKVSIDGKFKNYGSDESKEKATDFEVYGEIIENGESGAWRDDDGKQYYHTTNDFDDALKQAELWLSEVKAGQDEQDKPQEIDVSAIDTDLSKYGADNKTAVLNFLKQVQGKYINTQIGKVLFNRTSIDELPLGTKNNDMRAKLVFYVPQTLTQGEYQGRKELYKERKDSFVAFHEFINEVQIDNEMVKHCVKVGERETGEFVFIAYHSRRQFDSLNEKGSLIGVYSPSREPKPVLDTVSNNKVGRSQTGFDNIVLDEADDVNDEYDDVEFDDSTASLFDGLMLDDLGLDGVLFDDIEDDTDGWNIQIISITPIQSKEKELFGRTKPVNRLKMIDTTFVYADDRSMWSNGHLLVKEQVSDDFVAQVQSQSHAYNIKELPVNNMERLIAEKQVKLDLLDLASAKEKKSLQLAIFKTEQGNEVAVQKPYLQFFIKEFGTDLEYWADLQLVKNVASGMSAKTPICIYQGAKFVGLIMPMTVEGSYEKHGSTSHEGVNEDVDVDALVAKYEPALKELSHYDRLSFNAKIDRVEEWERLFNGATSGNTDDLAFLVENAKDHSRMAATRKALSIFTEGRLYLTASVNQTKSEQLIRAYFADTNAKLVEAEKAQARQDEQEKLAKAEQEHLEKERELQAKHGKAYQWVKEQGLSPLSGSRLLKVLEKQFNYVHFGLLTRGQFVEKAVEAGYVSHMREERIPHLNDINNRVFARMSDQDKYAYMERWKNGETTTVYHLENTAKNSQFVITKTEYDYAQWLSSKIPQNFGNVKQNDDESQNPERSPSNEDGVGALSQNEQENTMNEQQNPNYTQSDIDYLQSIINGTLDLETVDMDKMIEIGEKDEHDPMYEQALQVISEYLDKLTSV